MVELLIRDVRIDDAPSLADALREWGRDYVEMDAEAFRVPLHEDRMGYARTTIGFSKRV